jgi:hypothetical protein
VNGDAAVQTGRKPREQRTKQPDEALPYSVKHWIKVEVLAIFHEGEFGVAEAAAMMSEDVKVVRNHVVELYKAGCIELAGHKMVGNHKVPVYRAIVLGEISDEQASEMSVEERHDVSGAITQGILAETVSAYHNGKLDEDPVCLLWDAPHLDEIGRVELHALLLSTYRRAQKIHGKSVNRISKSGEVGQTTFLGLLGFGRGRPGRPEGGYFATEKSDRK